MRPVKTRMAAALMGTLRSVVNMGATLGLAQTPSDQHDTDKYGPVLVREWV